MERGQGVNHAGVASAEWIPVHHDVSGRGCAPVSPSTLKSFQFRIFPVLSSHHVAATDMFNYMVNSA